MPEPDHDQCREENYDPTHRDLNESETFRVGAQAEQCFQKL